MATNGKRKKPTAAEPIPKWWEAVAGRLGVKPGTRITQPFRPEDIHLPVPNMTPRTGPWAPQADADSISGSRQVGVFGAPAASGDDYGDLPWLNPNLKPMPPLLSLEEWTALVARTRNNRGFRPS